MGRRLASLADQIGELDSAAKGYWFYQTTLALDPGQPVRGDFSEKARSASKDLIPVLSAASGAAFEAAKSLPPDVYSIPLKTALSLERQLYDFGVPFTVGDSGFAAECLRAIFALGGLQIERVDYWLKQARDHEDSWTQFIKRHRDTPEG